MGRPPLGLTQTMRQIGFTESALDLTPPFPETDPVLEVNADDRRVREMLSGDDTFGGRHRQVKWAELGHLSRSQMQECYFYGEPSRDFRHAFKPNRITRNVERFVCSVREAGQEAVHGSAFQSRRPVLSRNSNRVASMGRGKIDALPIQQGQ